MPLSPIDEPGSSGEASAFEEFISETFGRDLEAEFDEPIAPLGVFVCFVNRSGSNYLAECLAASGTIPRAREFFLDFNLLRHRSADSGLSGVFERIVSRHSQEGVFAAKLGFAQLSFFDSRGFLDTAFEQARFILLKRRDTLAQAVSFEIASQTCQWKAEHDDGAGRRVPEYSRKRIELKREGILQKYDRFEEFFSERKVSPHTVEYEDLLEQPSEVVAGAGDFIGQAIRLDPDFVASPKPLDPMKQEWKKRFLDGS